MSKTHHPAIVVGAPREGFRRAGHAFGTRPKTIPLAALSPEEHAAIVNDRALVVVDTAVQLDAHEAQALKHHAAEHVRTAAAKLAAMPVLTDSSTADHLNALAEREAAIERRQAELDALAETLSGMRAGLDERAVQLDDRETTVAQRERTAEAHEAALAERVKAIESREANGRQAAAKSAAK